MADDPKDFREPKVTSTTGTGSTPAKGGGIPKWVLGLIAALVALLLLAWLLGLFAGDDEVDAVVTEEGAVVETD